MTMAGEVDAAARKLEETTIADDASGVETNPTHEGSGMTLNERLELALTIAEECIQPNELRMLLEKKPTPVCYDGFEPSGRMHIAQGVMKALNVNKLTKIGCKFKFWVADWFALMNNKMGGDLKKIQKVGQYMVECRPHQVRSRTAKKYF